MLYAVACRAEGVVPLDGLLGVGCLAEDAADHLKDQGMVQPHGAFCIRLHNKRGNTRC